MGETVRLTVVPNEGEAEMLCQMLRNGPRSRKTEAAAESALIQLY